MTKAIFPGSFDPITMGHLNIINRARLIFNDIIVLVLNNVEKQATFSMDERVNMIKLVINNFNNVSVDQYNGLLIDYIKDINKALIIKGIRSVLDFQYEFEMAMINKKLYPQFETIFLPSFGEDCYISSSLTKHLLSFDGDVSWLVPKEIENIIKKNDIT